MRARWLFAVLTFALISCFVYCDISSTDKARITSLTTTVTTVADKIQERKAALKSAGKAVSSLVGSIGKLAPFFGAAGAFLSVILAFLPAQDSAELAYMKTKFAEVNRKLDRISDKLDGIETLITYEAQRAIYIDKEHTIQYGYKKLGEFYDELQNTPCTTEEHCQRVRTKIAARYAIHFQSVESALDLILKGSMDKTVFRDALLDLVQKHYGCDVGKLTEFVESVIRLAEKAQEVSITYNKLTASNLTVVTSVRNWLDLTYKLRSRYYEVKNQCFDNMQSGLDKDVGLSNYQSDYSSNAASNEALNVALETKYAWLKWNVLSYVVPDQDTKKLKDDHAYQITDGSFNIPSSKEDRKRVIITAPVDPFGTYTRATKLQVKEAIRSWQSRTTDGCTRDKSKCVDAIVKAVTTKGLHKYIQTINVLKTKLEPEILERNPNSYIDDEFKFTFTTQQCGGYGGCTTSRHLLPVRVVIMLRSEEMSKGNKCTKACHATKGTCVRLPYSTVEECQCEAHFDGEQCLEHSKGGLASAVDSVVTSTLQIPSLVDIYYDVKDVRKELEAGVTRLDVAISLLQSQMKHMYDSLSQQIGQNYQWTNLKTNYAPKIKDIAFYSKQFKTRSKENGDARGKELAAHILAPGKIRLWVQSMDTLFMGSDMMLQRHLPLMIMYMDRYMDKEVGCVGTYKQRVDDVYKQFSILQQDAYLMWMEAVSIMEQEPGYIAEEYKKVLKKQNKQLSDVTCDYTVPHSQTLQCKGGHYIHPGMTLKNTCDYSYYRHGDLTVSCSNPPVVKTTQCKACNCDRSGAAQVGCDDVTGKCTCKVSSYQRVKTASYYGTKCDRRDCQWSLWSPFSSCSKACGYGGQKTRSRSHEITRYGKGKSCSGSSRQSDTCFHGCCSGQFDCSNRKKCIVGSYKCDYENNCGDKQDEGDKLCQEQCIERTSAITPDGGEGKVWWLDRQYASCKQYGSQWVLQSFKLTRPSGSKLSYKYRCCKLNRNILSKQTKKYTSWSEAKSVVFLDRHNVECPSSDFMSQYEIDGRWVKRGWKKKRYDLQYVYWCNQLSASKHRRRMQCKTAYTGWATEGKGQSWYLDKHNVDCRSYGSRWFLNRFQLKRKMFKYLRYEYKCCRVQA